MVTMNISLPPSMAEYVRRRIERDYGNASEFFRELVRGLMQREIEADLALLKETSVGAKPGPSDKEIEEILTLQKRLRKARSARDL